MADTFKLTSHSNNNPKLHFDNISLCPEKLVKLFKNDILMCLNSNKVLSFFVIGI